MDDDIAADEIARQIAALKPQVEGSRGVMAYLDKSQGDKRTDVNKTFLASTIRGVNLHNRRQEEDKCWTLRHMERKLDASKDRTRSRSRDRRMNRETKRRRSLSRSRSRDRGTGLQKSYKRRHSPDRGLVRESRNEKREDEDERSYWARKKAEKTSEIWRNLHSEGTVSVENAPDFSEDESDDDDIKPAKVHASLSPKRSKKKEHKKHKKRKKHDRKTHKKAKCRDTSLRIQSSASL